MAAGTTLVLAAVAALDRVLAEVLLLAAALFSIGGIDDLLVDIAFARHRRRAVPLSTIGRAAVPLRIAVFVPAWDEHRVIAAMLRTMLARYGDGPPARDWRVYVGCYPNDPATVEAVAALAATEPRVRLVVGTQAGPTTKADCLNTLWRALHRADAAEARTTDAIVLHDAEDVVHPAELDVFDHYLRDHALVQLPVVPLIDRRARLVSGHYADEFAESHGRTLVVRHAIGAGVPLAGVGCALRVDALRRLAVEEGPFAAASLTEDYETGLRVAGLGLPCVFARVRDDVIRADGALVATRAYFPDNVDTAVRQKARWMAGIELAGWDRIGWGRPWGRGGGPAEWWMRARDRRAPLAVLALLLAYGSVVLLAASALGHAVTATPGPGATALPAALRAVLLLNAVLLAWRTGVRAAATARDHGWREGLWSAPRLFVANYIAVLAARRALALYWRSLRGDGTMRWDKTAHRFPAAEEI